MNVQSINCQPIKPAYGSVLASRPAFKSDAAETVEELNNLKRTVGFDDDTRKKGLVGVAKGALMASIAWFTLIAAAPKSIQILSGFVGKVLNMGIIKKPAIFIKDQAIKLGGKIKTAINNIKPETAMGKIKNAVAKPCLLVKGKVLDPIVKGVLDYIQKNNINKPWLENACVKFLAGTSALAAFLKTTGLTDPIPTDAVTEPNSAENADEIEGDVE